MPLAGQQRTCAHRPVGPGGASEVKNSHDRYANIEVNCLLQRMEDYRGLAILATNRKAVLDTAFLRRLSLDRAAVASSFGAVDSFGRSLRT